MRIGSDADFSEAGVLADKVLARRDFRTHQRVENLVGDDEVVDAHTLEHARFGVHGGFPQLLGVHFAEALEALNLVLLAGLDGVSDVLLELFIGEQVHALVVLGLGAHRDLVERRLRDVEVPLLDDGAHEAEEKGEQQRGDVPAVHVGVGHDHDLVVAQVLEVEAHFLALAVEARADGPDQRADFGVLENLVQLGLFHVQDLAAQGQNRLEAPFASALGRAACRVAFHDEQFGLGGVLRGAVGELTGQVIVFERVGAPHDVAGLAGGVAGAGSLGGFFHDGLADLGIFLEELRELLAHDGVDGRLRLTVEQLDLGLRLELRVAHLDAHHAVDAFEQVVAARHRIAGLDEVLVLGVLVEHAGVRRLEAGQRGAAVAGADHVGVGQDVVAGVGVGVDKRHLDFDLGVGAAHDHRLVVEQLGVVGDQGAGEVGDAALLVEDLFLDFAAVQFGALVTDDDFQARQVGEFAQTVADTQVVELVVELLEDGGVGVKADLGGPLHVFRGGAEHFERLHEHAPLKADVVQLLVLVHGHVEVGRECVDHRGAHAVQPARHLVGALTELAARVQLGENHFDGGAALGLHDVHGNAASVVGDSGGAVSVQHNLDFAGEAREPLVDAVVDDFGQQLVIAVDAGAALHVHAGAFAHGVHAFEDTDLVGVVVVGGARRMGKAHLLIGFVLGRLPIGLVLLRLIKLGLALELVITLGHGSPQKAAPLGRAACRGGESLWWPDHALSRLRRCT
ncbi:conserved hypothetical protein [Deinococcus radiodurans R1 = ATCC 13939 = DSM 20539]|uniref:NAD-specific glutamate dehydrogenase n=1 Tax=Deinococcus radiodurans (strain ATCC 13939 / DSM 20539 / JCM 16871 / CCUG 27074 / LMG 4051 / NBRC 15346 / NCIMB 9279 / VKM B-1422 / R1) TaxID=243230 RepID=Q9RVW6_DEIRA|nr:conserved hypothetical protein [Deinococcus radiodurans R1 = ATCC 13939 = DSM 20539]